MKPGKKLSCLFFCFLGRGNAFFAAILLTAMQKAEKEGGRKIGL